MPSSSISIIVEVNVEALQSPDALAQLQEKLSDFAPILQEMGNTMLADLGEWFDSEGDGTWAPLKATTTLQKAREGWPDQSEVRTGTLRDALTIKDAPGNIFQVSEDGITIGIDDQVIPYADYQNDGTNRIPPRILVTVTPEMVEDLIQLVAEWVGYPDAVRVYAA